MSSGAVPTVLLLVGGAGAVIAMAAALSSHAARNPELPAERWSAPLPPALVRTIDARATRMVLRGIGLAATIAGGIALAGREAPIDGLIVLPGITVVSLIAGPVYRLVNPVRTLAALRSGVSSDRHGRNPPHNPGARDPVVPNDRHGHDSPHAVASARSAAVWLIVWCATALSTSEPRLLAVAAGVFVVAQAVLMRAGIGDPFEALAALLGNLAPVGRDAHNRLAWRNPLVAVSHAILQPGAVGLGAVVIAASLTHAAWRHPAWRSALDSLGGAAPALLFGAAVALTAGALRLCMIRPFMRSAIVPLVAAYGIVAAGPWSWPVGLLLFTGLHVVAISVLHRQAVARHDLRTARAVQFPLRVVVVASVVGGLALLAGP